MIGFLPFKKFAILEGLWFSVNGNLSTIEWEFKALVIGGWDDLNGMNL